MLITCSYSLHRADHLPDFVLYDTEPPTEIEIFGIGDPDYQAKAERKKQRGVWFWDATEGKDIPRTFQGHSKDIPRTFQGHSKDIPRTFQGHSKDIPSLPPPSA
jgi:hypothetical protein